MYPCSGYVSVKEIIPSEKRLCAVQSLSSVPRCARVGVTSVKVSWMRTPGEFLVVSAIYRDRGGSTPVHHRLSWTFPTWFPWWGPGEPSSTRRWVRVTRWCRCRRRWWPAGWEWSQWCPAWPGCSPPCFPCLGFPFPHHCGECWPFSQEKYALFVSNWSGANRQERERETQSIFFSLKKAKVIYFARLCF